MNVNFSSVLQKYFDLDEAIKRKGMRNLIYLNHHISIENFSCDKEMFLLKFLDEKNIDHRAKIIVVVSTSNFGSFDNEQQYTDNFPGANSDYFKNQSEFDLHQPKNNFNKPISEEDHKESNEELLNDADNWDFGSFHNEQQYTDNFPGTNSDHFKNQSESIVNSELSQPKITLISLFLKKITRKAMRNY